MYSQWSRFQGRMSDRLFARHAVGLISMSRLCYKHDARLRPSVTSVDCDHIVQQRVKIGPYQDRSHYWLLPACLKPTWIVISYDPEFYWGRPVGMKKCGVFHFSDSKPLACRAISASAELLVIFVGLSKIISHAELVPYRMRLISWVTFTVTSAVWNLNFHT